MFTMHIYPARNLDKVNRFNTKFTEVGFPVDSIEAFIDVVAYDNISCKCIGGNKSSSNFIATDCILMDIDNHNNDPNFKQLWEEVQKRIRGYAYYWVNSKSGNGYHCYFPLGEEYTDQKILLDLWKDLYDKISDVKDFTGSSVADKATKDRARLFFATTPTDYGYHEGRCWFSPPHEDDEVEDKLSLELTDKEEYGLNDSFCEIVLGERNRGEIYTSIPNYAIVMANLGYTGDYAAKLFCDIYQIRTNSQYKRSVINYINNIIDGSESYDITHIYIKEKYKAVIDTLELPADKVVIYNKSGNRDKDKLLTRCRVELASMSEDDVKKLDNKLLDSLKVSRYMDTEITYKPRGINLIYGQ